MTSEWIPIAGPMIQAGALIFAVWKASRSIDEWRVQRRTDKRAEVAGQALVVVQRYLDALNAVAHAVGVDESAKTPGERLTSRWEIVRVLDQDFLDAERHVLAYLGDTEAKMMNDILGFKWRLWGNQSAHLGDNTMWEAANGEQHATRIKELRVSAFQLLKPHATMTASTK